jgi:hypothetical protein
MLFTDIMRPTLVESGPLEAKLQDATAELDRLRSLSRSHRQSGRSEQYNDQIKRAEALVALAREEIMNFHNPANKEAESREFLKGYAAKRAAETPEEKKKRAGQAMQSGRVASQELGDSKAKAEQVRKIIVDMRGAGVYNPTAEDIAKRLGGGVLARSVAKWIQLDPNFSHVANLLGRPQKRR